MNPEPEQAGPEVVASEAPRDAVGAVHLLAVLAFFGVCWAAADLLIPVMLAMFFALIANPMVTRLHKWWIPRWLGALAVVFGGLAAGIFLASLLVGPASDWIVKAPTELRQLAPKLRHLTRQVEQANKAAESIVKAAGASTPATVVVADPDKPHAPNLWALISSTPRMLAFVVVVVLLCFSFLVYGEGLQRQAIAQTSDLKRKALTIDILRTIESEVSTYVLTVCAINTTLGLVLATALWWLGLDFSDALLWGMLAALLNFVPYVGPLSGVIALALVGVVAFDQPGKIIAPPLLYLSLHVLESQVVTPAVLGRRMSVSPLVVLLWLMLWGWLWGIAGLLLAVPMLTSCKIVAERVERWQGWAKAIE